MLAKKSWMVLLYRVNRLPPKIPRPTGTGRNEWCLGWSSEELFSNSLMQNCW